MSGIKGGPVARVPRRRTVRLRDPLEFPDLSTRVRDLARRYRAYCPVCGTVRYEKGETGKDQIRGTVVIHHEFATGIKEIEYCPGGEIDRVIDRAP